MAEAMNLARVSKAMSSLVVCGLTLLLIHLSLGLVVAPANIP